LVFKQVSYTYLHLLACSYAAFLKYEGGLRGSTTHQLALGNGVHTALEKMYVYVPPNVVETIRFEDAVDIFNTEYKKETERDDFFATYPQVKKSQAEGVEMIARYYAQMATGKISDSPMAVEKEFRLPIAGIEIVGKIDKVERTPEGLVVTDYKTGSKKPDEWFLRRNLQFTAYYWATKELYGEYPIRVQWHHLRTGDILPSERSEWDIEQLKRIIDAAVHMQEEGLRYRIYHEQVCGWCPFKGSVCDDPALEQQILDRRVA
jgi:CRISPR/Cas system-associated exonuclease Cas4 (RecB family)